MEENILEIVENSCRIHRDVIAVKYLSHRELVEKSYGDLWDAIRTTAEHILHWWEAALMNGSAPTWLYFSREILLYRWMPTCQRQNYMNF